MTAQHHQSSLLIAAHEPSQGTALADIIHKLRPDAEVSQFGSAQPPNLPPTLGLLIAADAEQLRGLSASVRSRHPQLGIVVITPQFDDDLVAAAAEAKATALVQSPCDRGPLLAAITEHERHVPFAGRAADVPTSELLRLHAQARSTGVLHFTSPTGFGRIDLVEGQPIDARCGQLEGASAVLELLGWDNAKLTWMAGHSARRRTMFGPTTDVLDREIVSSDDLPAMREAPPDVLNKLANLASDEDIVAAYLLRDCEVVVGHSDESVDEVVLSRALARLALVFHDMETVQGQQAGPEIQATMGDHRLVVDRVGPSRFGFQVGVVVKQATPVCKSLRRLLRQMDRSFRRSLTASARRRASAPSGTLASDERTADSRPDARVAATRTGLHRVA